MSDIGYSVFGTPRGLTVHSNGLFKEADIDKVLYLNNSDVVLENGETILLVRRIPLSTPNPNQKDGILVALYQQALQYGENRSGGFVGSAICFKGKMPNAEKIISGVFFLFKQIKKISLDESNRFKADSGNDWDLGLPDSNKNFGMFEEGNLFTINSSTENKSAIRVFNFEHDTKSVLQHFCLHYNFRDVDFLYVSSFDNVISKMNNKGIKITEFTRLFDYSQHAKKYEEFTREEIQKVENITRQGKVKIDELKQQVYRLETDMRNFNEQKRRLDVDITLLQTRKGNLEKDLGGFEKRQQQQRETLKQERQKAEKELNEIKKQISSKKNISVQGKNLSPSQLFEKSVKAIKNNNKTFAENNKEIENQDFVETYLDEMPNRKKRRNKVLWTMFGVLLFLMLLFVGLFIWQVSKSSDGEKTEKHTLSDEQKGKEKNQDAEFLEEANKYCKTSQSKDLNKFREVADILLKNYLDDQYDEKGEEVKFIKVYKWEFWEFDYTNDDLVKKLNLGNKDTYFINLEKELKPINSHGVKTTTLDVYLKEANDIYQNIDKDIVDKIQQNKELEKHFKWLVEKCNGDNFETIKNNKRLKLPFLEQ